jgi:hypothetical protein
VKISREDFDRFNAFIEKCASLPDKFIDTNLIIALLFVQILLVGVCTLYLKTLIYELYFVPSSVLEQIK